MPDTTRRFRAWRPASNMLLGYIAVICTLVLLALGYLIFEVLPNAQAQQLAIMRAALPKANLPVSAEPTIIDRFGDWLGGPLGFVFSTSGILLILVAFLALWIIRDRRRNPRPATTPEGE